MLKALKRICDQSNVWLFDRFLDKYEMTKVVNSTYFIFIALENKIFNVYAAKPNRAKEKVR